MRHVGLLILVVCASFGCLLAKQPPSQSCQVDHWPQTKNLTGAFRSSIKSYSIIRDHAFYILKNNTVYVTGKGKYGVLGLGEQVREASETSPKEIVALRNKDIEKIYGNDQIAMALSKAGQLWTWGRNINAEFDISPASNQTVITPKMIVMPNAAKVVDISLGWDYWLALDSRGQVWAWGANTWGQLGVGDDGGRLHPVLINAFAKHNISALATAGGIRTSAALTTKGDVYIWGDRTNSTVPELVGNLPAKVTEIAANNWNILMLAANGDPYINYKRNATDCNKGDHSRRFKHIHASNDGLMVVGESEDNGLYAWYTISSLPWEWYAPVKVNSTKLVSDVFVGADWINNPLHPPFMCTPN